MKGTLAIVAVLTLCAASKGVQGQALGDPVEGLAMAKEVCSKCHAVQKHEATRATNSASPTFVELANVPGMTSMALMVALNTPHAGMPMFVLTPEQKADIIAYILSLKEWASR